MITSHFLRFKNDVFLAYFALAADVQLLHNHNRLFALGLGINGKFMDVYGTGECFLHMFFFIFFFFFLQVAIL
jgi:hypothetical protein